MKPDLMTGKEELLPADSDANTTRKLKTKMNTINNENTIINDRSQNEDDSLPTDEAIESTKVSNVEKVPTGEAEKETDDWEVVEASSDESVVSGSTEYDIKVPVKLLQKAPPVQLTAPAAIQNSGAKPTAEDCILVVSDSENNTQQAMQSQNQNTKSNVSEKEKPKSKKKKFKLYTGDSSDDEVPKKVENRNQTASQVRTKENVQTDTNILHEDRNKTVKQSNTKESVQNDTVGQREEATHSKRSDNINNETFTKSVLKSHSDTELTDDNMALGRRPIQDLRNKKKPNLCYISEESDDEIVEVPRSPLYSRNHHLHSRSQTLARRSHSHRQDCQCNCVPIDRSPDAKRAKRQKLMLEHMWQEKEKKLKLKMVKKVKDVFFKVLESLVSSDESDVSLEESPEPLPRKTKRSDHHCFAHPAQTNHPDNVRDMKREIQYWKSKASTKEVLSPQEIQLRELKADLEYWKRVAMAKEDLPSSSSAIRRTSTPVKDFEDERVPTGTANVSSSADASHASWNPPTQAPRSVDYAMEDVPNHNETTSNIFKSAISSRTSQALSVMSRTKFTEKEKDDIIQYLIKNYDKLELIRGNMFWMQMAHDLDSHRSWHSLKNNFFQNIIKNLEQYEMPDKVRNKIISLAKQYM